GGPARQGPPARGGADAERSGGPARQGPPARGGADAERSGGPARQGPPARGGEDAEAEGAVQTGAELPRGRQPTSQVIEDKKIVLDTGCGARITLEGASILLEASSITLATGHHVSISLAGSGGAPPRTRGRAEFWEENSIAIKAGVVWSTTQLTEYHLVQEEDFIVLAKKAVQLQAEEQSASLLGKTGAAVQASDGKATLEGQSADVVGSAGEVRIKSSRAITTF
ncbi:MAG: hypothetical protein IT372_30605, partial [Polyangiaceae bacterium]|nr:hypothetical protein [Polyangiaceae bacterium]